MKFKEILLRVENLIHAISVNLNRISAVVLFIMMLFITVDIVARYLFKHAIPGSVDFVVLMMVMFVFPSFANTTYRRGHVRTDILYVRFSDRKKAMLDIFSLIFSVFIIFLITWQLGARAIEIIQNPPGIGTTYFNWPHLPFIIIAMVACGLMCIEFLIWLLQAVKKSIYG